MNDGWKGSFPHAPWSGDSKRRREEKQTPAVDLTDEPSRPSPTNPSETVASKDTAEKAAASKDTAASKGTAENSAEIAETAKKAVIGERAETLMRKMNKVLEEVGLDFPHAFGHVFKRWR